MFLAEACRKAGSTFSSMITVPVRERSGRKRISTNLASYLLTSDVHMSKVAEQCAKKKQKADCKSKSSRQAKNKVSTMEQNNPAVQQKKKKQNEESCSRRTKSKDTTKCGHCGIMYGEKNDTRINDEWVRCEGCCKWYHETCAEIVGLLEATAFTCRDCI